MPQEMQRRCTSSTGQKFVPVRDNVDWALAGWQRGTLHRCLSGGGFSITRAIADGLISFSKSMGPIFSMKKVIRDYRDRSSLKTSGH